MRSQEGARRDQAAQRRQVMPKQFPASVKLQLGVLRKTGDAIPLRRAIAQPARRARNHLAMVVTQQQELVQRQHRGDVLFDCDVTQCVDAEVQKVMSVDERRLLPSERGEQRARQLGRGQMIERLIKSGIVKHRKFTGGAEG
jgi:hypothetical protein